jgi:hypothetical protein
MFFDGVWRRVYKEGVIVTFITENMIVIRGRCDMLDSQKINH